MKRISVFSYRFSKIPAAAGALALAGFLACGGGGGSNSPAPPPVYAARLDYTDPTGDGYRFVRNQSLSSQNRLVLDLVGPASGSCRGVSFSLASDATKAAFARVGSDAEYVQNAVFDLGTGTKLFKEWVDGNMLSVSIAQKGQTAEAKPTSGALVRIALELKTNVAQNANISLVPSNARVLPAIDGSEAITIAVGTVVAR
jgi:hypothetical protein